MNIDWQRLNALGGLLFVALAIISFSLFGSFETDNGEKIVTDFANHRDRIMAGGYIACLGLVALVVWGWAWQSALRRTERTAFLAPAVFGFTLLTAAAEFPVMGSLMSLAYISDQPVDPQVARSLLASAQVFSYVDYFPTCLLFASVGYAVLHSGIINRWFGWSAFALAIASLVVAYPPLKADLPAAAADAVWLVTASIALFLSHAYRDTNRQTTKAAEGQFAPAAPA